MFTKGNFESIKTMAQIEAIEPRDFEWFCKFLLDQRGYSSVQVTKKYGENQADRGIDLEIEKDGEKILGQCKQRLYSTYNTLRVHAIRELGGCMLRDNVKHGVMMTTFDFDELDRREAKLMNIELFGHDELKVAMTALDPTFDSPEFQKERPVPKKPWRIWLIFKKFWRVVMFIFRE